MYSIMHTQGDVAAIYFVFLILIGSFFVINLAVAVIYDSYSKSMENMQAEDEEDDTADEDHERSRALSPTDHNSKVFVRNQQEIQRRKSIKQAPGEKDDVADELAAAAADEKGIHLQFSKDDEKPHDEHQNYKQSWLLGFVISPFFSSTVTLSIVCNCVILAWEYEGQSLEHSTMLEQVNNGFAIFFLFEMLLKQCAFGLGKYFDDPFNTFDCLIVGFSVLEFCLMMYLPSYDTGGGGFDFTSLRVLRLLRIMKLARNWSSLQSLVTTVMKSGPSLVNFVLILCIFLIMMALVSMQLYGGKFTPEHGFEYVPRNNFDSFASAFVTVFQVATGEDWNAVMYDTMMTVPSKIAPLTAVFFVFMFFVGNYILVNLFLAMLLENFEGGDTFDSGDGLITIVTRSMKVLLRNHGLIGGSQRRDMITSNGDGGVELSHTTIRTGHKIVDADPYDDNSDDDDDDDENDENDDDGTQTPEEIAAAKKAAKKEKSEANKVARKAQKEANKEAEVTEKVKRAKRKSLSAEMQDAKDHNFHFEDHHGITIKYSGNEKRPQPGDRDDDSDTDSSSGEEDENSEPSADELRLVNLCSEIRDLMILDVGGADVNVQPLAREHTRGKRRYPACFTGAEAVEWILARKFAPDAEEAIEFGRNMLLENCLQRVDHHQWAGMQRSASASNAPKAAEAQSSRREPMARSATAPAAASTSEVGTRESIHIGKESQSFARNASEIDPTAQAFDDDEKLWRCVEKGSHRVILRHGVGTEMKKQKERMRRKLNRSKNRWRKMMSGRSLGLFSATSPTRKMSAVIITSEYFSKSIYFFIFASSMLLAVQTPSLSVSRDAPTAYGRVVFEADLVCTVVFIVEAVLKVVAMGFLFTPNAYLKSGWNQLDFFIVCLSLVSVIGDSQMGFFKALRTLRALRPLRVISRSQGMKMVVNSIVLSIPAIMNVMAVILLFFIMFGIAGVNFFKGKLGYCHGAELDRWKYNVTECTDTSAQFGNGTWVDNEDPLSPAIKLRTWSNPPFHFDNIFYAMLTLFEVATLEMWPNVMFSTVEATGRGTTPVHASANGSKFVYCVYFVLFIVVGAFFVMNLFVGVVIDKFSAIKKEMNGSAFLTDEQKQWRQTQKMILRSTPPKAMLQPDCLRCLRMPFYTCASSKRFEAATTAAIMANVLYMGSMRFNMSEDEILYHRYVRGCCPPTRPFVAFELPSLHRSC
jgi:hypothetical protein